MERSDNFAAIRFLPKGLILIALFVSTAAILVNRYVLAVYRAPLAQFPDRYRVLSSVFGEDFAVFLNNNFCRSYHNVLLFIASLLIIFYVIKSPKIKLKFKYLILISLVLFDLVVFNAASYMFMTTPKVDLSLWPKESLAYNDKRVPLMLPRYPFFGFAPAMQRIFTAFSSQIPGKTTHFYEMRDFFNFNSNAIIRPEIKEIFTGITGERIKLVSGAVVLPLDHQVRECGKLDEGTARMAVFIEENPPEEFSRLKIPLEKITDIKPVRGSIVILWFDPNNMLLEVNAEAPCFLYYSDGFDRSWRAFIDGRECKVYRANMAFKSVILDKGRHVVRFIYDPRFYKITLFCYFAGLSIATFIFAYMFVRKLYGKNR